MTIVEEVRPPARPLPLWSTLREAFLFVWDHRWHFGRLLIIPFALTTLLGLVGFYWIQSNGQSGALAVVMVLSFLIIFTFFGVSCHRIILIGEQAVSRWGIPRWSMRETRFFLCLIGILGIGFLGVTVGGVVFGIVLTLFAQLMSEPIGIVLSAILGTSLGACITYMISRLSLSLPAAAVDQQPTINAAWSQSEGNGWRLTILLTVPGVLLQLADWLIGGSSIKFQDGIYSVAFFDLKMFCIFATVIVLTAILSISFRELSKWQREKTVSGTVSDEA